MVQQVHLQNGLLRAHGLHGEVLGADDGELLLLRHLKVVRRGGRGEALAPQALGQAGLVLQNLPLDISHRGIDGAAHIAVGVLRLGAEQRAVGAANGQLHHAAVLLLHGKGHKGVCLLRKILIQLTDLLFRVFLDGVVEGDLLAGECELHNSCSFRQCGKHRSGSGSRFPLSLSVL